MNKVVKVLSVAGIAIGMSIGGAVAANAASPIAPHNPPITGGYETVAWLMPSYVDATTSTWPQTLSNDVVTADPDLGALDSYLTNPLFCGRAFQVDVYNQSDVTNALVADGHLTAPNVPQEDLIAGGWGTAYKILKTADCVVVPPVLPTVAILPVTTTNPTCTEAATYTVPVQPTGVKYALANPNDPTSARPVPGTFTLADGVSLTIVAHTIAGYQPADYSITVTGHDAFPADNPGCVVTPTPPTTPNTPATPLTTHLMPSTQLPVTPAVSTGSLAFTGATTGWLIWPAAALLALGGILMVAKRQFIR